MAYVNVAEWKTEQVCEWLKGLDNAVLPYVHSFTNNKVNGQQLLNLRPEDLEQLGVLKLGHQEIILEAVEYLRNFHYELDRENLQLLALRLSCQAHSLHNELCRQTGSKPVTTQTLSDVVAVVMAVKPLVRWLDRPPFSGQWEYNDKKTELLKLSIEMSTCAQRDRFAEKPIEEIRNSCGQLAKLADYIIQDISDPMILHPATLDLATLKKKPGDELGFYILPSFHGTHQIAEIKFSSAAHQCGKMEEGDEIVQVNYQTVVGWERKNVLELFNESPAEVLLTLKRRPRHRKVYGQIYIKPYRLPSNKKTTYTARWQHNLPSPRPELLTIPDFTMPLPRHTPKDPSPEPTNTTTATNILDTMATDSGSSSSDSETEPPLSGRLYASKPRSLVQRRATITGASPTTKHGVDIEQFWRELKQERNTTFQLRDKAASCAHGLDSVPSSLRPQTCLGIEQTNNKRKKRVGVEPTDEKRVQFNEKLCQLDKTEANGLNRRILNDANFNNVEIHNSNTGNALCIQSNDSDNTVPSNKCSGISNNSINQRNGKVGVNKVALTGRKDRGKLDKSHSTPAYDLDNTSFDVFDDNKSVTSHNHNKLNVDITFATNSYGINVDKTDVNSCVEIVAIDNLDIEKQKNNSNVEIETVDAEKNMIEQIQQSIDKKFIIHCDNDVMMNLKVPAILNENNTTQSIDTNDNNCEIDSMRNLRNKEHHLSNEVTNNKSNELLENNIITSKIAALILKNDINNGSSRESSEEKSESTGSYMDGIYSSSSEPEAPIKSENLQTPLSITDTRNNNRIIDEVENSVVPDQTTNSHVAVKDTSTVLNTTHNAIDAKDTSAQHTHGKRMEQTKSKQTPPEPPPRKYFTRPSPLNLNTNDQLDIRERPRIPDRPDIKKDTSKDILSEKRASSEVISVPFHQREYFEGYRDFVDKSTDFIDEQPSTPAISEKRLIPSISGIDHFGYSDIYEKQLRDDRPIEKYELFTDKFGSSSPIMSTQHPPELPSRMADSPDGAGCSRQVSTPELKVRTLEKDKHYDKGVVNRAMMVARSIGLHGSSKISSGSPRSSRKRNMLLAKRRNVSVKDIGPGDLDGWLTYRSRGAGGAWARSWFVLKGTSLYRFKNQESTKSDCLIALPGFTASQASEVKSRKFAFKVYHTGTVFYFAADNDDNLSLWLDSINKVTLGADSHNRSSGLFSETDESDVESPKNKPKGPTTESKSSCEKTFGSLKKIVRKESSVKESSETGGASLDRKYLRFLGARTQNVPVPTAQFRSYRRVLPSSTPRKPESTTNSPDHRVVVAGSTFYGLSSSHSATDVPNTTQDMSDYRQATDRSQSCRSRRPEDLRGFVTLEEFMLSHQNENRPRAFSNRSASPRLTPLNNDHVNIHHRHYDESNPAYMQNHSFDNSYVNNGMIYGHPRNGAESPVNPIRNDSIYSRNSEGRTMSEHQVDMIYGQRYENDLNGARTDDYFKRSSPLPRKTNESTVSYVKRTNESAVYYPPKQNEANYRQTIPRECQRDQKTVSGYGRKPDYSNRIGEVLNSCDINNIPTSRVPSRNDSLNGNRYEEHRPLKESNRNDTVMPPHPIPRRYIKDNGYSGSSGDLSTCSMSETLQRAKKEASVSRKGSFNLNDRSVRDHSSDKNWIDSLRRSDKKVAAAEKIRLKNVTQYQPPPMPNSPFDQDGMRAAFEMHLDKGSEQVQKVSRLKSLFGSKNSQKPTTLDITKEPQKTLLGSPRLHRALFRDKSINQRQNGRSGGQSPGDSGFSQSMSSHSGISYSHTLSQSFSSASSVSDWSPDGPIDCSMAAHRTYQKRPSNTSKSSLPPTLPYIPPPTSPPPDDYPGLEYPPVFEPGTYSLSDASLLRTRSVKNQNDNNE